MDGLKPPLPPPELRSKALAAAREQLTAEAVPDVWSRIWNSRGIRLAWAASVMVLLVGHILATLSPAKASTSVDPSLVAEHRVDEDYVDLLRPIRISDTVQPMVGLIAGASSPSVLDLEENPS
jgi:hypothetical protein